MHSDRSSHQRCFIKHLCRIRTGVFYEFWENFKNTFFTEYIQTTASALSKKGHNQREKSPFESNCTLRYNSIFLKAQTTFFHKRNLIGKEFQSADINWCYKLSKELAAKLKGALKSCFTRYLCVIIILFNTVLCKSSFYTYSFGNKVPRLSLFFLCSFF